MNVEEQMAIGPMDGMVILRFLEPMEQVAFPPALAIEVAESFTAAAFEADSGLKPVSDTAKAAFVERARKTLTRRLEIVLNSKRDKKAISNARLSQELVDICLKEVF